MRPSQARPFKAGTFLITPTTRSVRGGCFKATLSIRNGQADAAPVPDRTHTFKPEFASRDRALMYAAVHGRYWLINPLALS